MFLFFKTSSLRRRTFIVFTNFKDSQLVSVHLTKTFILRVRCPELFDLIIPGPLFCLDCLSTMMVSIISSWSCRFPSSEHYLQLLFFSYSDVMMTPGFDQKVQKSFAACLYPHVALSLHGRMVGQSFLGYLNLLHS